MGTMEDGGTMADREDAAKQNPFWIEEEFHRDRPSADGRLPRETAVYELLDRLGISYQRIDHDPVDTIADCEAVDRKLNTCLLYTSGIPKIGIGQRAILRHRLVPVIGLVILF